MPKYPKVTSRKIKYPQAPSGYAKLGKYIPPFENNETGFGFKGVLTEDFASGKIECCECGKWFENLSTHIFAKHKLTAKEYKIKFGLLQSTALKSKRIRLRQSEVMSGMRRKHKKHRYKFAKNNPYASNRKGIKKALESQNKYGVCELQIMKKVEELRNELGKTPTLIQLKNRYGYIIMTLIHSRFNSYIKLCKDMGLDANYSNFNPKYSREYFIEKALSNEANIRIFTLSEQRRLYSYFKGGIKELRDEVNKVLLEQ